MNDIIYSKDVTTSGVVFFHKCLLSFSSKNIIIKFTYYTFERKKYILVNISKKKKSKI